MQNNAKNEKIIKNTLFLYTRMILVLAVGLYTSRILLSELGVEDFGIYSVVAGVVTMMSFMTGAMSASTQRFLSYELANDGGRVQDTFIMSVNIHIAIFLVIVLIIETIGLWFLNYKLNIPEDRIIAANWAYQCALISFGFTIMSIPYIASIISNERMGAFAYIGVLEVSLKLAVAFILCLNFNDNLIIYSVLLAFSSALIWFLYFFYCRAKVKYTRLSLFWDKELFGKLLGFTGWNLVGNIAVITMNQGLNILLNIFFGPVINASRAISNQVNMAIRGFSSNLQMSMNPVITKSYASGQHEYMQSLILKGSKYSFLLLFLLALPVLLQTEEILMLWLGQLPEKVVIFCQLSLIDSLIVSLSGTLITGAQANGNIKYYQIVTGGVLLLNFPLTYALFSFGTKPEIAMVVMVFLSILALFTRLAFLRKMIGLSIRTYFKVVLVRAIIVSLVSSAVMLYIDSYMGSTFWFLIGESLISIFIVMLAVWALGLDTSERQFIMKKLRTSYNKL